MVTLIVLFLALYPVHLGLDEVSETTVAHELFLTFFNGDGAELVWW